MPLTASKLPATCILVALLCAGCAATGPVPEADTRDYKSRAETHREGQVLVSASALSASESREVYGHALDQKGVQPIWVEVENGDASPYWLMSPGIDPNFFLSSELADAFATPGDDRNREILRQRFDARNDGQLLFYDQVLPGSSLIGYVNADHWALGIPLERSHEAIGSLFVDQNNFPREALLEALLRFIEEELAGHVIKP